MTMTGTGPGQAVRGYIANPSSDFDPVRDAYPTVTPPPDFSAKNEGFAGIIHGTPTGGGATLSLYCIDINTLTYPGLGYQLGTWDASGVPNVGYVARLLNDYYPHTNEPASLSNVNQKAAAVQAAIWFFSDRYVLSTSDPLYSAVVAIVDHVKSVGPLVEPPPPSLSITPTTLSGTRAVLGPFTLNTDHAPATVTAAGGTMYSNPAGTTPLGDGTTATVPSGQQIWLRSAGGTTAAALQATSTATVPSGNVYLYDGNTYGVNDAQRLILAEEATLKTTVSANAEFQPSGSLVVEKTIAGPAAGSQGRVVIRVTCDDGVARRPLIIRAGTRADAKSRTYRHILAGTKCTVTESSNGGTATTTVVVIGDGQNATIPSGGSATVKIKDIYRFVPGSLLVRKTITGLAAGQQGQIVIQTKCNGKPLNPDFVIAAGAPQGLYTKQYDRIRVPARCTVTETADGHTTTVGVIVEGSGQTVSIGPGDIAGVDISDTYGGPTPGIAGDLDVSKTITGPLAGQQGMIVIHTVCDGTALSPDFVIPAGATGVQSHVYSNIPTPATCLVTETVNGATSAVSVVTTGNPQTATIPANGAGAAHITDVYGATPGSLLVTKTIAGPLAGHQGPVTLHAVCDGTALSPDFVIPAGTRAGTVSHSFDNIPAGSVCTVTEATDGGTDTVVASVFGDGQTVTVPAGSVVTADLADVYQGATGSLKVTKTLAGPAARQQGEIAMLVDCGGPVDTFAFTIRAHTAAGSVSRHFDGLPAGARCTVTETADGSNARVAVAASAKSTTVTIRRDASVTAHLTDTFASVSAVSVTG